MLSHFEACQVAAGKAGLGKERLCTARLGGVGRVVGMVWYGGIRLGWAGCSMVERGVAGLGS